MRGTLLLPGVTVTTIWGKPSNLQRLLRIMRSLIHTIIQKSRLKSPYLVGVSGIDGSGKGYISKKLHAQISFYLLLSLESSPD